MDVVGTAGAASAVVGSLKSVLDLFKGVKDLKGQSDIQQMVSELKSAISDAQSCALESQSEQAALMEKIRVLQSQLESFQRWERIKDRYELIDFGGQTYAYSLKKEHYSSEPKHLICPVCIEKRQRSILQFENRSHNGQDYFFCHSCNTRLALGVRNASVESYYGRSRDWIV